MNTFKPGDTKLVWTGKENRPCTLVCQNNDGDWIVRLDNGMLFGPVAEGRATLR